MPTFTISADQTAALLDAVAKTRIKSNADLEAALERIHAALDGKAEVPVFTVQFLTADGTVRASEVFRRKESKHLTVETRLEQKINKEAALLLDGEAVRIVSGDATAEDAARITRDDVLTFRGSETALSAACAPVKVRAPRKRKSNVKIVEVAAEVQQDDDALVDA